MGRMARNAGSCGAPARLGCLVLLALLAAVFLLVRADASPCESITSANVAEAMGDNWSGWLNREGIVPGPKGPLRLSGNSAAKYACELNPACKWTGGPRWRHGRMQNVCVPRLCVTVWMATTKKLNATLWMAASAKAANASNASLQATF